MTGRELCLRAGCRAVPPPLMLEGVSVPFSMGTVLHHARQLATATRLRCFSPLLDGDGVAPAPELSHSTPLTGRSGNLIFADLVSASNSPLSANSGATIRPHNSLRT